MSSPTAIPILQPSSDVKKECEPLMKRRARNTEDDVTIPSTEPPEIETIKPLNEALFSTTVQSPQPSSPSLSGFRELTEESSTPSLEPLPISRRKSPYSPKQEELITSPTFQPAQPTAGDLSTTKRRRVSGAKARTPPSTPLSTRRSAAAAASSALAAAVSSASVSGAVIAPTVTSPAARSASRRVGLAVGRRRTEQQTESVSADVSNRRSSLLSPTITPVAGPTGRKGQKKPKQKPSGHSTAW